MKRKTRSRRAPRRQSGNQTMMKGMMNMTTLAVGGAVAIGTIGAVGSILKP
jgi:hypothetical protein